MCIIQARQHTQGDIFVSLFRKFNNWQQSFVGHDTQTLRDSVQLQVKAITELWSLKNVKKPKRKWNSIFLKERLIFYFGNKSAIRLKWRQNITEHKLTEISQHFFVKFLETIFHENMHSGSLVVTSVQTDWMKHCPENVKQICSSGGRDVYQSGNIALCWYPEKYLPSFRDEGTSNSRKYTWQRTTRERWDIWKQKDVNSLRLKVEKWIKKNELIKQRRINTKGTEGEENKCQFDSMWLNVVTNCIHYYYI